MMTAFAYRARCPGLRFGILGFLLLLAALPGCKGDGLSDYQREQNQKESALEALHTQGAKVETKSYPQFARFGSAYAVNLSGATITPETFENLKGLQRVSELDLSKSSLTDDQMDQLNEVANFLVRLDLSNTAVTDAGLEKLTNLNLCFNLILTGAKVTPAGVEGFKQQRLARSSTKVKNMKIQMR